MSRIDKVRGWRGRNPALDSLRVCAVRVRAASLPRQALELGWSARKLVRRLRPRPVAG